MTDVTAVQVAVRVRPFQGKEVREHAVRMKTELQGSSTWVKRKGGVETKYDFDHSFQSCSPDIPGYVGQDHVFRNVGAPILDAALEGRDVCLFAYGQTGAGKSYSMVGKEGSDSREEQGIVPRVCQELFKSRDRDRGNSLVEYDISIQVVEIYCEKIHDLLAPRSTWKKGGHDPRFRGDGCYDVPTAIRSVCTSYADIERAFKVAEKNRSIGSHELSAHSSRAHTLYMISYKRIEKQSEQADVAETTESKINLIDLAGSEKMEKAGTTGAMVGEGIAINMSLSVLGNCIRALSEQRAFVPFGESVLTRLLRSAMTNGRVVMIAAVSPSVSSMEETRSTLEFAKRIKLVRIKAEKHVSVNPLAKLRAEKEEMERSMQAEIDRLKSILAEEGLSDQYLEEMQSAAAERHRLQEENKQLLAELIRQRSEREEMQQALTRMRRRPSDVSRVAVPRLRSLSDDPHSEVHFAVKPGGNTVGYGGRTDISVKACRGVMQETCTLCFEPRTADSASPRVMITKVAAGARVLINGRAVYPADLLHSPSVGCVKHNTRLCFGEAENLFLFEAPGDGESRRADGWQLEAEPEGEVTRAFALREIGERQELESALEDALSAGDSSKADMLRSQLGLPQHTPRSGAADATLPIPELQRLKKEAAEREDYREAGRLQQLIASSLPPVPELERMKRLAVEGEDYDEAHRITELLKLKRGGSIRRDSPRSDTSSSPRPEWPAGRSGGSGNYAPPRRWGRAPSEEEIQLETSLRGRVPDDAPLLPATARTMGEYHRRNMFVGRATMGLSFLVDKVAQPSKYVTLPLDVHVEVPLGPDQPQLMVNVYQFQGGQRRFALGDRVDFVVHVICAKGIPATFSYTVFCKYIFKWGERDVFRTPELKHTTEPNFDFKKRFAFPKLTQELMDWFQQPEVMTFEVVGIGERV